MTTGTNQPKGLEGTTDGTSEKAPFESKVGDHRTLFAQYLRLVAKAYATEDPDLLAEAEQVLKSIQGKSAELLGSIPKIEQPIKEKDEAKSKENLREFTTEKLSTTLEKLRECGLDSDTEKNLDLDPKTVAVLTLLTSLGEEAPLKVVNIKSQPNPILVSYYPYKYEAQRLPSRKEFPAWFTEAWSQGSQIGLACTLEDAKRCADRFGCRLLTQAEYRSIKSMQMDSQDESVEPDEVIKQKPHIQYWLQDRPLSEDQPGKSYCAPSVSWYGGEITENSPKGAHAYVLLAVDLPLKG